MWLVLSNSMLLEASCPSCPPHHHEQLANLASMYRNQERSKEAEELDVQVMETGKRMLGEEHPDTLTIWLIWHRRTRIKGNGKKPKRCFCK
ncbi:hypothetical protein EJ02DRAFT_490836 [Clathrospora elynae]|uniref:Kinesin light chain n=1 Tax=Clathrospora elynae TaxID=706981 RepID=A0A6A5S530_9PLEO|nr:hypothetical protein EJ02DRAFT_490838 [Clathrospora elynae]KAF1934584.1 hypothetical protein EJ02DRAFT_490836 [Clathrospora elynae]